MDIKEVFRIFVISVHTNNISIKFNITKGNVIRKGDFFKNIPLRTKN